MDPSVNPGISIVGPKRAMNNLATAELISSTANPGMGVFSSGDVRVVSINEYKKAAKCLAEAFAEDDVARYFTHAPDNEHWTEESRYRLHVEILEYIVYAHIMNGLVLAAGEDYGCVALWCAAVPWPIDTAVLKDS